MKKQLLVFAMLLLSSAASYATDSKCVVNASALGYCRSELAEVQEILIEKGYSIATYMGEYDYALVVKSERGDQETSAASVTLSEDETVIFAANKTAWDWFNPNSTQDRACRKAVRAVPKCKNLN